MEYTAILNVHAVTYSDRVYIASKYGVEPDATIVAHRDIAYYRRIVGKIAIFSHMRGKSSDRFY
jgi:hypothetical protein